MYPKVSRGAKMTGLLLYLQGPGKSNEHTNPRIIAGSIGVREFQAGETLTRAEAIEVAEHLDTARVVHGIEVSTYSNKKVKFLMEHGADRALAVKEATHDVNVWQCSLALHPTEGQITDETWQKIAGDFAELMGFDGPDVESPARWAAVHHGLSGNPADEHRQDHIHFAVTMVREDGSTVDLMDRDPETGKVRRDDQGRAIGDFARVHRAAAVIERRYGLQVWHSEDGKVLKRAAVPGYHQADVRRARDEHDRDEPAKVELMRRVRAHATAARGEGQFVDLIHGDPDVVIAPYYAKADKPGVMPKVTGYRVALVPRRENGERDRNAKLVWFGGKRLGEDLSLPELRASWGVGRDEMDIPARQAWMRVREGRKSTAATSSRRPTQATLNAAHRDLAAWTNYLRSIPPSDKAAWSRACAQTAGVFAAWSAQTEARPGPLARAANTLSAAAAESTRTVGPKPTKHPSAQGAALIILQATGQLNESMVWAIIIRQLLAAVEAIADAKEAANELGVANELRASMSAQLAHATALNATLTEPAPLRPGGYTPPEHDSRAVERGGVRTAQRPAAAGRAMPGRTGNPTVDAAIPDAPRHPTTRPTSSPARPPAHGPGYSPTRPWEHDPDPRGGSGH